MEKRESNIVYLKDLLQRGIHIEQASEFQTSIFSKIYEDATQSVQKIVEDNRVRKGYDLRRKEEQEIGLSNVISFIGRRGTGKSSAMLSFREALDNYNMAERHMFDGGLKFNSEETMKNVCFLALDYIDASVLEESEDIFILVLANMLNYLEKNRTKYEVDSKYRELMHEFDVIYKDFLTLKESKQYKSELFSTLEQLLNVACSQKIKNQFYELVSKFLNYIWRTGDKERREMYLVISIDDLDMAHYNSQNHPHSHINNKSYEIVNSIHKYLSIPGVIVLTAYNHVNLMLQSENFFINSDITPYHTLDDRKIQRKTSSKLSNQFVDKVFALDYRIYMPSWKKDDYQKSRFKVDTLTGFDQDTNIFKDYSIMNSEYLSIKKLMLLLYKEKLGVYYDCEGKKNHFLEPDSLRRLSDAVKLFDDEEAPLVKMSKESNSMEYRRKIFRKVKGDIYFRYIQEKLYLPEEKDLFSELLELRIDRRSEEIVKRVSKKTKRLGKAVKRIEKKYTAELERSYYRNFLNVPDVDKAIEKLNDNSNVKYSFAELVHSIYHMTRDEDGYSKEMVACILHSYSIYLSELYDEYRNIKQKIPKDLFIKQYRYCESNQKDFKKFSIEERIMYGIKFHEQEEIYGIFKAIIGDSICGRWCEYFFPEVHIPVLGGYIPSHEREKENLFISSRTIIFGYSDAVKLQHRINIYDEHKSLEMAVKEIIFVSMLYVNVLDWEEWDIDVRIEGKKVQLFWGIEELQPIEMTAYMKYAFRYPEFLHKMEQLLMKFVKWSRNTNQAEYIELSDNMAQAIDCVFKDLWNQFVEWDEKYGNMVLPIHNFDCTYNLIKHVFQETSKREASVVIKSGKDFIKEFNAMNNHFLKRLYRIDRFYGNMDKNIWSSNGEKEIVEKTRRFGNIFRECPLLKLTNEIFDNKEASYEIGKIIMNIIAKIAEKENISLAPDEWQEKETL